MQVLSNDTRIGQAVVLFFTTALFLGVLPFYFFADNLILPAAFFVAGLLFNWIASRNHYIYLKEGNLYIESLYSRQKIVSGGLFLKIDVVFPAQTYYYLYFKNGQRYSFSKTGKAMETLLPISNRVIRESLKE